MADKETRKHTMNDHVKHCDRSGPRLSPAEMDAMADVFPRDRKHTMTEDQDYELTITVRIYGGGTAEEAAEALRDYKSTFDLSGDREVEIIAAGAQYPRQEGEHTVLGPEIFTDRTGDVIAWKGQNYARQPEPAVQADATGTGATTGHTP